MKIAKQAYWLLPITWGIWIIYLSLLPAGAGLLGLFGIPHFDKVAHCGAYAVWSFLFLFAAQKAIGSSRNQQWVIILLLILVGCGLEYGQYFMHEGRSFEVLDMVANGLGVGVGALVASLFFKNRITSR